MKTQITLLGIVLDVEFDHQPYEKMTRYDSNGEGHPGCPASIENIYIDHKGEDVTELLESHMDQVEELIWEELEK